MKKALMIISLCVLTAGGVYADNAALTDDEYKNLAELRQKVGRMKRELDLFMKEVMATSQDQGQGFAQGFGQDVRIDLSETQNSFIVKADLPGMGKDKINIVLENGRNLTISGEREVMQKETSPGVVRQERMKGGFKRVIELPGEGTNSGISATYKDGVLEIVIPKKKVLKEDKVQIKVQ